MYSRLYKTLLTFLLTLGVVPIVSAVSTDEHIGFNVAPQITAGVIGASLGNAEEALVRSSFAATANQLKGGFGERLVGLHLDKTLKSRGSWQSVSLSSRAHGIDLMHMKLDEKGNVKSLLISEVKYGSSKLGRSVCGKQMSTGWIKCALDFEAKRHQKTISTSKLQARPRGQVTSLDTIEVPLKNGQKGYFWRQKLNGEFRYDGPKGSLSEAKKTVDKTAKYLEAAAKGKVGYRTNHINIQAVENKVIFRIGKDHKSLKDITIHFEKNVSKKAIQGVLVKEISKQYQKNNPALSKAEANSYAKSFVAGKKIQDVLETKKSSYASMQNKAAGKSLKIGLVAGGLIEATSQGLKGEFNPEKLAWETLKVGAATTAGTWSRYTFARLSNQNTRTRQVYLKTAQRVGVPVSASFARVMGKRVGGVAAMAVYSVTNLVLGDTTLEREAASFLVYGASSMVFVGAKAAMITGAATYGTASTGTAISALSGVAKTKAALAYWGGGSVATGGAGVQGGALVVGGVAVAVTAAVVVAAYKAYDVYSDHQDNIYYELAAERFMDEEMLTKSVGRWHQL